MYTMRSIALATLLASTSAWNTDVHNQIGFMAETFLTPLAAKTLSPLLEQQYNSSIGRAAAWADGYAHTPEGRFSYQWHWIDSHDDAPTTCNLDYPKDCAKGGCVVSQIANQTGILRECISHVKAGRIGQGVGNLTCAQALMWVAHFVGDVHQPLHSNARAIGGNLYKVIFGGVATQLHSVWDGFIPYFAARVSSPFSTLSLDPFFANLVSRIHNADFSPSPSAWLACTDPSTPHECAISWAREGNKWDCDYVWSKVRNDTDLGTNGYAAGAVPIVELQISKAALRLATWLNRSVEKEMEKEEMSEL